jgi:hypothetical protein
VERAGSSERKGWVLGRLEKAAQEAWREEKILSIFKTFYKF